MVAVPTPTPFTLPLGSTVAILGFDETQLTVFLRSWVLPSEKCPIASRFSVSFTTRERLAWVIAIEVRTAAVTVTVVAPDTPAWVAVMVALPTAVPVTRPLGSTVAMSPDDEVQLSKGDVRTCALPSEKVPVAVSSTVVPLAIEGPVGATTIEVRTAGVTVTEVVPDTPAWVAVMVALPTAVPVTRPLGSTVAMSPDDEVQLNKGALRIWVVPSEKVPVAVSDFVVPLAREGFGGVIEIEVKTAWVTVTVVVPDTPA
jgi:hypothetical protein